MTSIHVEDTATYLAADRAQLQTPFGGPDADAFIREQTAQIERLRQHADSLENRPQVEDAALDESMPSPDEMRARAAVQETAVNRAVVGVRAEQLLEAGRITPQHFAGLSKIETSPDPQQFQLSVDEYLATASLGNHEAEYLSSAAFLGETAPNWQELTPAGAQDPAPTELLAELDRLEFSARVSDLHHAGRIDAHTVQTLSDMADESADVREFRTRFNYGGARMMPAAEYRYLVSALETPEGQRPQTWPEAEAYARAWGADRYDSVRDTQQIEQDRELLQAPAYAM